MVSMHPTCNPPAHSGKLAALFLLALALFAALGAGWYYYRLQHRPLRHWGAANARLIVLAPRVWVAQLEPVSSSRDGPRQGSPKQERILVHHRQHAVSGWKEISQAHGLANIRHVFINDHAYDWARQARPESISWRYLLRFQNGGGSCTLVMDARAEWVHLAGSGKTVCMAPAAAGLRAFMEEQLSSADTASLERGVEDRRMRP